MLDHLPSKTEGATFGSERESMPTVSGYALAEIVTQDSKTITYRGTRLEDNTPVLLKILSIEHSSVREISKLRRDYEIAKGLDPKKIIVPYALARHPDSLVLLQEDFGGIPIVEAIASQTIDLQTFLSCSIQLSEILGELYRHNIIHKNLNPHSIYINLSTQQVKITDFSISAQISRENQSINSPTILEGTLAYMSPEQTGRMNRAIDYRSDFYSLGAVFYEILTGQVPFPGVDSMELVHCLIAKQPASPISLNPSVPPALSDIVMKLVSKNAEDRYRSAYGLKADLEACLTQWQAGKAIESFSLAQKDVPEKLEIPQQLYGRDAEIAVLMSAFERVCQGATELMLVSGYSGIGKSVLVNEIQKPITRQRGYFVSGKYEQLRQDQPYSAFIAAFKELIRQLVTEEEERVRTWKTRLLEALGFVGQVIIDVIPELEFVIGPQPLLPELAPAETQKRFHFVFQNFIHVFSQPDHPLVIFLDDLQWSDRASLNLLKQLLIARDSRYLFFIGAYRHNEVKESDPLTLTINEVQEKGGRLSHIVLHPLDLAHINHLVSDTLNCPQQRARPLADLILKKTDGNPFFMNEFIKSLYAKNLLTFDFQNGVWQWDISQIQAQDIADNVIDLMSARVQRLSAKTLALLKFSACIGNQFDVLTLSTVTEKPLKETTADLWEAVSEGLILPLGDAYHMTDLDVQEFTEDVTVEYKFAHDQIHQAIYNLIPETEQKIIHWRVGQSLLHTVPEEKQEQEIFRIVNQLNLGNEGTRQQTECDNLAQLNLLAGRKARTSTAYDPALHLFQVGLELLGKSGWERQYDLSLALHLEAAEAAYLTNNFEQMEWFGERIRQQAKNLLDEVNFDEVRIRSYIARNNPLEGIKSALSVLKRLGVHLPEKPNRFDFLRHLIIAKFSLYGKKVEELANLPLMQNQTTLAATRILEIIHFISAIVTPDLFPIITFKQIRLSVRYGNTYSSASAYAVYGIILCMLRRDIETGYQFGQLALRLSQKSEFGERESMLTHVLYGVYVSIAPWKEHLREILGPLYDGYKKGLEVGDHEFAGYFLCFHTIFSYFMGRELGDLEQESALRCNTLREMKQKRALYSTQLYRQAMLNLRGESENPCMLLGTSFDEQQMSERLLKENDLNTITHMYLNKLFLCYLFHQYPQAIENSTKAWEYHILIRALYLNALLSFYDSLARLAMFAESPKSERKCFLRRVTHNQRKMKKWARHAPINYLHKFYLVEAERARVLGKEQKAEKYFEKALSHAQESHYIHEEALVYELTGRFYLARDQTDKARRYLRDAHYRYLQWGALAKVRALEAQYPFLLQQAEQNILNTLSTPHTELQEWKGFDITSVFKASQALSGEIVLDKLLARLMRIAIENAGAQKGCLLLEKDGHLMIEAEGAIDRDDIAMLQSLPLEASQDIPSSVIYYVERTKENVILDNVAHEGIFTADPYVRRTQPKSILCVPLINKSNLIGILYLENNLTTRAFTPDRLEVLSLLSTEAAISIENARLYRNLEKANAQLEDYSKTLEQKVEDRTQELNEKNQALEIANQQVQEATDRKSQFLAGMSHELRTPLNSIIGFSDVLLEKMFGELNEKQEDYVEDIVSSGRHLLSLINDILDLSKVEAGRMELEPGILNLRDVLEGSLVMVRERALTHGIALTLDIGQDIDTMLGDERKVKQILFNLLSNAVKFTPDQGKVGIQAKQEASMVQIAVWDTGVGIAQEDQDLIFEEFHQVGGKGFTAKVEGTGLGLALTKKFVEMHGGTIQVESMPGVGSTFTVTLPIVGPEEPPATSQTVTLPQPEAVATGPRALVIEDDPKAADLLRIYLAEAGYHVDIARDGAEGLEQVKQQPPDVIILDILLPKLDGWSFLTAVKTDPTTRQVPVIIVSVVDQKGKGFALGAAEYLVKPIHKDELLRKLETFRLVAKRSTQPQIVLIIDEDPKAVELLVNVLEPEGFRVLTAANGEQGIALAQTERPDVIVLDLVLPGMNGFDVMERLAASPETGPLPIVLFTLKQLTAEEKEQVKGRITGLVHKQEFSQQGFVGTLRELLQRPLEGERHA